MTMSLINLGRFAEVADTVEKIRKRLRAEAKCFDIVHTCMLANDGKRVDKRFFDRCDDMAQQASGLLTCGSAKRDDSAGRLVHVTFHAEELLKHKSGDQRGYYCLAVAPKKPEEGTEWKTHAMQKASHTDWWDVVSTINPAITLDLLSREKCSDAVEVLAADVTAFDHAKAKLVRERNLPLSSEILAAVYPRLWNHLS